MESNLRKITQKELLKNNGEYGNNLWILIHGHIYDVTDFKHPGGRDNLLDDHGEDRGEEFDSIHSASAKRDLKQKLIGKLVEDEPKPKEQIVSKKDDDEIKVKQTSITTILIPFAIIALIILYYIFNKK